MIEVIFFPDGNTAVLKDEEQVPKLQKPYILMFANFLKTNGIDPLDVEFILPSGKSATLFVADDREYNWRIK